MTDIDNEKIENNNSNIKNDIDMSKYKVIEEKVIIDENGKEKQIVIVQKKYKKNNDIEKLKESQKKYYEKNKDKVMKRQSEYENERYKNDEAYRMRRIQANKESYLKRKQLKELKKLEENNKEI